MVLLVQPIKCKECGHLAKPFVDFIVDKFTGKPVGGICPNCESNL